MALKLLVVDDETEVANALSEFGKQSGYVVHCAYTGRDALDVATRERPDVMLLDIGLPGLDGRDLMTRLNKEGLTQNAVVLFVTGRDAQTDRLLGLELGADDYETKPLHLGRLFRKIERLMKKKRGDSTVS